MNRASKAAERRRVQNLVNSSAPTVLEIDNYPLDLPTDDYSASWQAPLRVRRQKYLTAIHESAHVVVAYALGTTVDIEHQFALSISSDGTSDGRALIAGRELFPEQNAIIDFSGVVAERNFVPTTMHYGYLGDAWGIFNAGVCYKHPEFDARFDGVGELLSFAKEHPTELFFRMMLHMRLSQHAITRLRIERVPKHKAYMDSVHALCNFSPEQLDTNGIPEYFAGFEGFELLRPLAARSWNLVRENLPAIKRLADELYRLRFMSGEEVHELVTQSLAVSL